MVGEDKPGGYDKAVSTILISDSSCDFEELISKEMRRKISASHCTHVCLLRVSKSSAGGDRRVRAMFGFSTGHSFRGAATDSHGRRGTDGNRHLLPTTHVDGAASQIST